MNFVQHLQEVFRSLFQWWVIITPWQQGIRVRMGRTMKLLAPGIHFKLPIFDVIYMQPIRVRAQHISSQTLTTTDGKAITLSAALQYEIKDLLQLYKTLHNAHDTIEQKVQGVVATHVHKLKLLELNVSDLEEKITAALSLDQFGLAVHGFNITSFAVVKTYRLISGEIGTYTGYDQRLETNLALGEVSNS